MRPLALLRRSARAVAGLLLAASLAGSLVGAARAEVPELKRGINFELWQTWTNREQFLAPDYDRTNFPDWTKKVDDARLAALRRQGFDFVRLNVDPSPMLWDESRADALVASTLAAVKRLQALDFKVVVDLHPVPDSPDRPEGLHYILGTGDKRPSEGFNRYLGIVRAFATKLKKFPTDKTALELMNEPDQDWFSPSPITDRWPNQLSSLYYAARKVAPSLPLVLSGPRGGGVEGLMRVDARRFADDDAVIWSFHIYDPGEITHSGLPWEKSVGHFLTGLPFPAERLDAAMRKKILDRAIKAVRAEITDPAARAKLEEDLPKAIEKYVGSEAGPKAIETQILKVTDWTRAYHVAADHVMMGEFGVFQDKVDPAVRAEIIRVTRVAAEKAGFSWAIYTAGLTKARSSFGILDDTTTMKVDDAVAKALGLR